MPATRFAALSVIGSRPSNWLWFQVIFDSGQHLGGQLVDIGIDECWPQTER
jgi:hypothetical protein